MRSVIFCYWMKIQPCNLTTFSATRHAITQQNIMTNVIHLYMQLPNRTSWQTLYTFICNYPTEHRDRRYTPLFAITQQNIMTDVIYLYMQLPNRTSWQTLYTFICNYPTEHHDRRYTPLYANYPTEHHDRRYIPLYAIASTHLPLLNCLGCQCSIVGNYPTEHHDGRYTPLYAITQQNILTDVIYLYMQLPNRTSWRTLYTFICNYPTEHHDRRYIPLYATTQQNIMTDVIYLYMQLPNRTSWQTLYTFICNYPTEHHDRRYKTRIYRFCFFPCVFQTWKFHLRRMYVYFLRFNPLNWIYIL